MSWYGHAHAITFPATGSQKVLGPGSLLMGWALLETTGVASATAEIWDGQDATGQLLVPISLTAGQSTRDWLAGDGVLSQSGLFLNVVSGTVRGVVWVRLPRPVT
jgi:hypothetical protein